MSLCGPLDFPVCGCEKMVCVSVKKMETDLRSHERKLSQKTYNFLEFMQTLQVEAKKEKKIFRRNTN